MVIGVGGSIGSGKSVLFSQYLQNKGYEEIELAYPMKNFFADWYQQDKEIFYNRIVKESQNFRFMVGRELIDEISNIIYGDISYLQEIKPFNERIICNSPRELLQVVGTDILRFRDPDIHLWWSFRGKPLTRKERYYVQALRFENEIDFIKQHGGVTVYIDRQNNLATTGNKHKSENSVNPELFDYVMENNGSLQDFFDSFEKCLQQNF